MAKHLGHHEQQQDPGHVSGPFEVVGDPKVSAGGQPSGPARSVRPTATAQHGSHQTGESRCKVSCALFIAFVESLDERRHDDGGDQRSSEEHVDDHRDRGSCEVRCCRRTSVRRRRLRRRRELTRSPGLRASTLQRLSSQRRPIALRRPGGPPKARGPIRSRRSIVGGRSTPA